MSDGAQSSRVSLVEVNNKLIQTVAAEVAVNVVTIVGERERHIDTSMGGRSLSYSNPASPWV